MVVNELTVKITEVVYIYMYMEEKQSGSEVCMCTCNLPKNGTTARQESRNSTVGMPSPSLKTKSSNL